MHMARFDDLSEDFLLLRLFLVIDDGADVGSGEVSQRVDERKYKSDLPCLVYDFGLVVPNEEGLF